MVIAESTDNLNYKEDETIREKTELGYPDSFILRLSEYIAFIVKWEGNIMAHLHKSAYLQTMRQANEEEQLEPPDPSTFKM